MLQIASASWALNKSCMDQTVLLLVSLRVNSFLRNKTLQSNRFSHGHRILGVQVMLLRICSSSSSGFSIPFPFSNWTFTTPDELLYSYETHNACFLLDQNKNYFWLKNHTKQIIDDKIFILIFFICCPKSSGPLLRWTGGFKLITKWTLGNKCDLWILRDKILQQLYNLKLWAIGVGVVGRDCTMSKAVGAPKNSHHATMVHEYSCDART